MRPAGARGKWGRRSGGCARWRLLPTGYFHAALRAEGRAGENDERRASQEHAEGTEDQSFVKFNLGSQSQRDRNQSAQGCEERATLGKRFIAGPTLKDADPVCGGEGALIW